MRELGRESRATLTLKLTLQLQIPHMKTPAAPNHQQQKTSFSMRTQKQKYLGHAKVQNRKRSRRQPKLPTADRPIRVPRVDASPDNVKRAFETKELQNNPSTLE